MVAGHRHDHLGGGGDEEDVPRRGQLHVTRGSIVSSQLTVLAADVVDGTDHVLPAGAGDRRHGLGFEVDPAQGVVDGVGDDELVADPLGEVIGQHRDAAGFAEGRRGEVPVDPPAGAGADAADDRGAVGVVFDEAVVTGVGHEQVPRGQPRGLARVEQVGLRGRRRDIGAVPGVEGALGRMLGDEALDDLGQPGGVALARHRRHEVALGVDHGQCRPSSGGVGLPGDEVGVVEDEVFDLVALHGLVDGLDGAFELELRGVDADDDEFLGVLLLERAQLVEDVEAVDAAEGPEVQQDDLAAQVRQGQLLAAGVHPPAADEFGGADLDVMRRGLRLRRGCAGARRGGGRGGFFRAAGHDSMIADPAPRRPPRCHRVTGRPLTSSRGPRTRSSRRGPWSLPRRSRARSPRSCPSTVRSPRRA